MTAAEVDLPQPDGPIKATALPPTSTALACNTNRPRWWSSKVQGVFEVYVCTKCGLAEWWVKDPGALQPIDGHLEFLDGDGDPAATPYR